MRHVSVNLVKDLCNGGHFGGIDVGNTPWLAVTRHFVAWVDKPVKATLALGWERWRQIVSTMDKAPRQELTRLGDVAFDESAHHEFCGLYESEDGHISLVGLKYERLLEGLRPVRLMTNEPLFTDAISIWGGSCDWESLMPIGGIDEDGNCVAYVLAVVP